MEFKLQDFVAAPSVDAIHNCTKENVFAMAEYYGLEVSRQAKKQVLVWDVCAQLVTRGIIPAPNAVAKPVPHSVGESVRLKELEVELQHL